MTNRERIETYDNREFARFLAWVAGYGGNKEEVDFWEGWLLKGEMSEVESWVRDADKAGDTEESDAEFMCKAMSETVNKSTDDRNFIGR